MGSAARPRDSNPERSLTGALQLLLNAGARVDSHPSDRAVHASRKILKRARAGLRLLRTAIGEGAYRRANRQLRDAARPLTQVRDAVALIDALEGLRQPQDTKRAKRYQDLVRHALEERHRLLRRQLSPRQLRVSAAKTRAVDVKPHSSAAGANDASSARRGIKRTFRSGAAAFAAALEEPGVPALHELRKQAKYLANELDLAKRVLQIELKKPRRRATRVAERLGDDRDLALLSTQLQESVGAGAAGFGGERQRLLRRIRVKRRKLQAGAGRAAKKLYRMPVARLNRRIKKRLAATRRTRVLSR